MNRVLAKHNKKESRKRRVRAKVKGTTLRPRLSVFRSNKFMYAQIIDDEKCTTLISSNTRDLGSPENPAVAVGKDIAGKAIKKDIKQVVFDRSGYRYTGNVKKIADAAREAGLEF